MSTVSSAVYVYLAAINLYVFGLMYYDKQQAKHKKWRVPEANLLFLSVLGGGMGGILAQQLFRHKTQKMKFTVCFIIGMLVASLLIGLNV